MADSSLFRFWRWFLKGEKSKGQRQFPGIFKYFDWWLLLHVTIGIFLACIVHIKLSDVANTVLLPLAGILIGLCFAWAGNAQALMQTEEIEDLSEGSKGGLKEYVYTYQAAILIVLFTLVAWAFAGFGVYETLGLEKQGSASYFYTKFLLFFLSSIAIRDCWQVVLSAQWLLLARNKIRRI